MNQKRIVFLLIISLLIPFAIVYAGEDSKVGTAVAPILKMGSGARPQGMGGAFVAISDDVNGIYCNPGGLYQSEKVEFILAYTQWFEDMKCHYIGFISPLKNANRIIGLSFTYFGVDDIDKRDSFGNRIGSLEANDIIVSLSYSHGVSSSLGLGMTVKGIFEKLGDDKGQDIALDIGALYHLLSTLRLGLNLQNIGPQMDIGGEKGKLPFNIKTGLAYTVESFPLILAVDVDVPVDDKMRLHYGVEYALSNLLSLRFGYNGLDDSGSNAGYTAGFGIGGDVDVRGKPDKWLDEEIKISSDNITPKIVSMGVDYACVSYGDFGYTHRISFSIKF